MKQGSFVDEHNFMEPWTILFLNFASENFDKEESQGSFQPLNMGIGWVHENQKTDERETCQKTHIHPSGEI